MIKRTLFIENNFTLRTKNEQLIIQDPRTAVERPFPIEDIGFVVLEHPQIHITQPAIHKLLENNVSLIYCDAQTHMPVGLVLPLEGNTLQSERFRNQIETSVVLKKNLWKKTIETKIYNQARVMQSTDNEAFKQLDYRKNTVKSGDTTNQEGLAARHYWKHLFAPQHFERDRFGLSPNQFLNYGYAILRAATARALVGSGLLPTLGIHHHNRYNAFCLADDIMEPYRPWVDFLVWTKWKQRGGELHELRKEDKTDFLKLLTHDVRFGTTTKPLMVGLTTTTASLERSFAEKNVQLLYPEFVPW